MSDLNKPREIPGRDVRGRPAADGAALSRFEDTLFTARRLWMGGAALLFGYATTFLGYIWLRVWPVTADGSPRFIDFVAFWINGRFALTPAAARAYDYASFAAAQAPFVALTRGDYPYYHLVYPPFMFPLVAPPGLLPFTGALALWIAATGSLYLVAVHRAVPRALACLLAVLPFAAVKNVWLGQTGFLVAGLLGLALALMEARPFLAGLCLGVLTCKPQYGIVFPAVLIAAGQWRMIAGACTGAAGLALAVTGLYGTAIWRGYAAAFGTSSLDNFMTDPGLDAIDQTVFGVMHCLGAGFATKWAVHAIAAVAVTAIVCGICRRPVRFSLKAAAAGIAALAATPYMLAYDLTALTIPAMFLVRDALETGFAPGERITLLGCFLALLLMQQMPVGPFILAALLLLVLRRAAFQAAR